MANKRLLVAMLFLFIAIDMGMVGSNLSVGYYTEPLVPAVYIFGDSTFDVGTNNFLNDSTSKADKPFYGIDSPNSKPTGRFCNGYNTADRIVNFLGYPESPPPFLYIVQNDTENFNSQILKGVNFASGGAGIMYGTGQRPFVRVVPMADQIQQFTTVHSNISQHLNGSVGDRINKSLFLISVGSNDLFEFFFYNASHSKNATQELLAFFPTLMATYQAHLKNLINLGARKLGIVSLAPLGCLPDVRATFGGNCSTEINAAAQLFNIELQTMMQNLSLECPEFKYSIGNALYITIEMIDHPHRFGLSDATKACCGNKTLLGGTPCSPNATLCEDRDRYLFWDDHHPTAYASYLAAQRLYSGGIQYVTPTNLSLLVQPS